MRNYDPDSTEHGVHAVCRCNYLSIGYILQP